MSAPARLIEPGDVAREVGLDPAALPRHLAIIMDGNGRWARRRGLLRMRGHARGADVVRVVTTRCAELGIARLTLYAFSSENWQRPEREVRFLMNLLERFLDDELPTLLENGIRFEAIGRLGRLPDGVRARIDRNRRATAEGTATTLCLALSYGGRDELVDACRALAAQVASGSLAAGEIDAAALQAALYAPDAPDVDLVIRTAGEQRLSNFLPWQTTYAEYCSVAEAWPDFDLDVLHRALRTFQARERRYGRVAESG